jgi:hypothetical protein
VKTFSFEKQLEYVIHLLIALLMTNVADDVNVHQQHPVVIYSSVNKYKGEVNQNENRTDLQRLSQHRATITLRILFDRNEQIALVQFQKSIFVM